MATNSNQQLNNVFINTFVGGMNTDITVDAIKNTQYTYMQNYRIATLSALGGEANPNSRSGIVAPVERGVDKSVEWFSSYAGVLATASVDNDGIIIVKDSLADNNKYHWVVYHVHTDENGVRCNLVFGTYTENGVTKYVDGAVTDRDKFSVVLNRETSTVLNLYIADGEHGVITINVLDDVFANVLNVQQVISNGLYPHKQAIFVKTISGSLETSQVQYCYRFYKKNGVFSKLSPETRPMQVINKSKSDETGCAEKTKTAIGFRLRIPKYDDVDFSLYTHVLLFRIQRLTEDETKVYLVTSRPISDVDNLIVDDTGVSTIAEYSIEEFSAMLSLLDLVPQCIEAAQHRMFQANVKDETVFLDSDLENIDSHTYSTNKTNQSIISKLLDEDGDYIENIQWDERLQGDNKKYYINNRRSCNDTFDENNNFVPGTDIYGGQSGNITWKFVYTEIPLHDTNNGQLIGCNAATYTTSTFGTSLKYLTADTTVARSIVDTYGFLTQQKYYNRLGISGNCTEVSTDSGYNGPLAASFFRSLRRDETYRYGIVYYNKYGKRTNVQWIDDIKVPSEKVFPSSVMKDNVLYARPIGIEFEVTIPDSEFETYQIVRCAKLPEYTKNLYQVVINPTIHNSLNAPVGSGKMSPWYPMPFLLSHPIALIGHGWYTNQNGAAFDWRKPTWPDDIKQNQFIPHIMMSEDINVRRLTTQKVLAQDLFNIDLLYRTNTGSLQDFMQSFTHYKYSGDIPPRGSTFWADTSTLWYLMCWIRQIGWSSEYNWDSIDSNLLSVVHNAGFGQDWDKTSESLNYAYYDRWTPSGTFPPMGLVYKVLEVKDTKQPSATDGFANINYSGDFVQSFSSKYQLYTTSILNVSYLNWFCGWKYGLGGHGYQWGVEKGHGDGYGDGEGDVSFPWGSWDFDEDNGDPVEELTGVAKYRAARAYGWLGPGPISLVVALRNPNEAARWQPWMLYPIDPDTVGCWVWNLQHSASDFNGISKTSRLYDTYYGHGCYGEVNNGSQYVFDGDVYIAPAELISMYKAYEFNSASDSLPSTQIVNYVPMESVINPYFEYGLNYRNTSSANIMVEPGEVTGVVSQDRPAYTYNYVYSCNDVTSYTYSTDSEDTEDLTYLCRIFYSDQKTDGEQVDNYGVYKALSYIDADTRWGQITNLLSLKDTLYLWQKRAFGKLSINERSLVTDENDNTIQLGEGGVLERVDYVDTTHGMREHDFAAITVGGEVFWIDSDNRMVILYGAGGNNRMSVQSYSVKTAVQSLLNQKFNFNNPVYIDYDVLNAELLCKCLTIGQVVFKPTLGIAQSVYTRLYDDTITLDGVLYGVTGTAAVQYNKLTSEMTSEYLSPAVLEFVANAAPTTTKVFDNQLITILKKENGTGGTEFELTFMNDRTLTFKTDLLDNVYADHLTQLITNREGNIQYAIPRVGDEDYGNRLRGKWMQITITDNNPVYDYTVSSIITKFRQSFS